MTFTFGRNDEEVLGRRQGKPNPTPSVVHKVKNMWIEVSDTFAAPWPGDVHSFATWSLSPDWFAGLRCQRDSVYLIGRECGSSHAKIYLLHDRKTVFLSSQNAVSESSRLLEFRTRAEDPELWAKLHKQLQHRANEYVPHEQEGTRRLLMKAESRSPGNSFVAICREIFFRTGRLTERQRRSLRKVRS